MSREIKILIVDDIENMRKLMASMLLKLKFSYVTMAASGREAWTKLKADKFDLVITDWNMPNMSGLELLKAIREDEKLKTMPVLMITAEAVKENIVSAAKYKVNGYIVKPFSPATLDAKIIDIMDKID